VTVLTSRDTSAAAINWEASEERSYYDVLGTHRGASDEELRRAYKRQRDLFQPGSLSLCSLVTEAELTRESLQIEEAQETLLDPLRRRTYDLSFFADHDATIPEPSPDLDEARRLARQRLAEELAHEVHSETVFTGELLRRVRESQGIQLSEIAGRTKISQTHLESIENEDFDRLPAEVYTRGFVQQLASFLGLDATQASRTYLRRFRSARRTTP
jgi:flagellar biosynthesis protein FlhG